MIVVKGSLSALPQAVNLLGGEGDIPPVGSVVDDGNNRRIEVMSFLVEGNNGKSILPIGDTWDIFGF